MHSDDIIIDTAHRFFCGVSESLKANGKGVQWQESRDSWLLMRLRQEVEELADAMTNCPNSNVQKECIDVAAFAMMIWDLSRR